MKTITFKKGLPYANVYINLQCEHLIMQSFNNLYNANYASFLKFAIGYVRDQYIAEDFVSESFMIYWEKRNELTAETNPRAYILTVLKNKCLNHLKHLQIKNRVNDELTEHAEWLTSLNINSLEAFDTDFVLSKEINTIVDATISKLPIKTRQAFVMSRKLNLTNKEIAAKMNFSEKSVEYHISKAISQLRISLKDFLYIIPFIYLLY